MSIENNTGKTLQGFSSAYLAVSVPVRRRIRERVTLLTGWSPKTFYNKMAAITPLRPFEDEIIKVAFEEYGIDAATGMEITEDISL